MAIIKTQTIKNTLIDYLGIALGFVNMSVLFPHMLSKEELGLRGLMLTLAGIGANFSALGIGSLIIRFFPFFKTNDKKHQGFFNLIILIPFIGFIITVILVSLFKGLIIKSYIENSPLLVEYFPYAYLMCFGLLYANILNSYLAILLKTVVPQFFRHVALRIVWLLQVLLYYYEVINFEQFVLFLALSYFVQLFGLLIYGFYLKQIPLAFYLPKVPRKLKLIMTSYALFAIAASYIGIIVNSIDQLMIASIIGTAPIAVYSIAIYLTSVMYVPGRSLQVIAGSVLSYNLKQKNIKEVKNIYRKSAVNMGVSGAFVFLLLWVNIESYIQLLPEGYENIKYIMLFLGIGKLFDIATGTNAQIIELSKFYRFNLYSALILIGITIGTNLALIPIYEIEGAAIATAVTLFVFNILRMLFLKWKMNLMPYNKQSLYKMLLCIIPPFIVSFLFVFDSGNIYLDFLVNTLIYSSFFGGLLLLIKPSEDIHAILVKHWNKYTKKGPK